METIQYGVFLLLLLTHFRNKLKSQQIQRALKRTLLNILYKINNTPEKNVLFLLFSLFYVQYNCNWQCKCYSFSLYVIIISSDLVGISCQLIYKCQEICAESSVSSHYRPIISRQT